MGELTLSGDDWTTIDKPINMKAEFNEEDISGEVTWSVSDDDIATIDADGKLTFNTHGNITVTATYMGISGRHEQDEQNRLVYHDGQYRREQQHRVFV